MQEAAQPGARAHGFVTGVQEYGVFVSFCNGVRGLAPTQQLGLEPNQDPSKQFPIGKASSLCHSRADSPLCGQSALMQYTAISKGERRKCSLSTFGQFYSAPQACAVDEGH